MDVSYLAELPQDIVANGKPCLAFLMVFSFIFAALGKSRSLHFERLARVVIALVLAFHSASFVRQKAFNQIIAATDGDLATGPLV